MRLTDKRYEELERLVKPGTMLRRRQMGKINEWNVYRVEHFDQPRDTIYMFNITQNRKQQISGYVMGYNLNAWEYYDPKIRQQQLDLLFMGVMKVGNIVAQKKQAAGNVPLVGQITSLTPKIVHVTWQSDSNLGVKDYPRSMFQQMLDSEKWQLRSISG